MNSTKYLGMIIGVMVLIVGITAIIANSSSLGYFALGMLWILVVQTTWKLLDLLFGKSLLSTLNQEKVEE